MLVHESNKKEVMKLIGKGNAAHAEFINNNRDTTPVALASKIYKQLKLTPKMDITLHPELMPDGLTVDDIKNMSAKLDILETAIGIASVRCASEVDTSINPCMGDGNSYGYRRNNEDVQVQMPCMAKADFNATRPRHENNFSNKPLVPLNITTKEDEERTNRSTLSEISSHLNEGCTVTVKDGHAHANNNVWLSKEVRCRDYISPEQRLLFRVMSQVISD